MRLILLAAWLLAAQETPEAGKVLRVSWALPSHLDPHRAETVADARCVGALFEGLTTHGADGVTLAPGMAEKWEESADGLAWTFALREAKWSNGEPVTALDFVAAWRRALQPAIGCPYRDLFRVFKNVGRHLDALRAEGRSEVDEREYGFEALDARTLRVTLGRRTPWLPDLLAFMSFAPLHGWTVLEKGEDWVRPGRIVTNGPYLLESASPLDFTFRRNPGYWDGGAAGAPARIRLEFLPGEAALKKFEAGQLDWIAGERMPPGGAAGLKGRVVHPVWGTRFLRFNASKPPFDRAAVRAAFARAIDREGLAAAAGELPAERLVPPGLPGYAGGKGPAFDRAAAVEGLLRETEFDLAKFPRVDLLTDDAPRSVALGRWLRDQLERILGIVVRLSSMKSPAYAEAVARGEYQVAVDGWMGDYFDPLAFLETWTRGHPRNAGRWASAEFDAFLAAAEGERDPRRRMEALGRAEALLLSSAPVVPLLWPAESYLASPRLKGLHPNPMGRCPLKRLRLEGK